MTTTRTYPIAALFTREEYLGYLAGSVIEHTAHFAQPDALQHLRLARDQLSRLLALLEGKTDT